MYLLQRKVDIWLMIETCSYRQEWVTVSCIQYTQGKNLVMKIPNWDFGLWHNELVVNFPEAVRRYLYNLISISCSAPLSAKVGTWRPQVVSGEMKSSLQLWRNKSGHASRVTRHDAAWQHLYLVVTLVGGGGVSVSIPWPPRGQEQVSVSISRPRWSPVSRQRDPGTGIISPCPQLLGRAAAHCNGNTGWLVAGSAAAMQHATTDGWHRTSVTWRSWDHWQDTRASKRSTRRFVITGLLLIESTY